MIDAHLGSLGMSDSSSKGAIAHEAESDPVGSSGVEWSGVRLVIFGFVCVEKNVLYLFRDSFRPALWAASLSII